MRRSFYDSQYKSGLLAIESREEEAEEVLSKTSCPKPIIISKAVFNKEAFDELLPRRPVDHAIELKQAPRRMLEDLQLSRLMNRSNRGFSQ